MRVLSETRIVHYSEIFIFRCSSALCLSFTLPYSNYTLSSTLPYPHHNLSSIITYPHHTLSFILPYPHHTLSSTLPYPIIPYPNKNRISHNTLHIEVRF